MLNLLCAAILIAGAEISRAEAPASASANTPERDVAQWLIDAARHHGHLIGRDDPRRVTFHVLALMKAASDVDPTCASAWMWQFDLLSRMGRDDEALDALSRYVALEPTDESAQLQRLALSLSRLQTSEARGAYLKGRLDEKSLPDAVRSDIHRRLAEYFFERGQTADASTQVEHALKLMPLNLPARELAYDLADKSKPPARRVEMALQVLAMSPGRLDVMGSLAQWFDEQGMNSAAQEWYARAIEIQRRGSTSPPDARRTLDLALSFASDGNSAESLRLLEELIKNDRNDMRPRLIRVHVAQRAADHDGGKRDEMLALAKSDVEHVAREFDSRFADVQKANRAEQAAELAWFYAMVAPDKTKALTMARIAVSPLDPTPSARTVMGFALLVNEQYNDATKQFAPLADADPFAALGLGKTLAATGKKSEAIAALKRGAGLRYSGIASDLIGDALRALGENPPQPPAHADLDELLRQFDRRVFDLFARPADTLKLTVEFMDPVLPVAGPCRLRIRLTNINPRGSFSVTLGDGLMVRPRVVLSAKLSGKEPRTFRSFTEVFINRKPVLAPGESIETVIAADVGQLHEELVSSADETRELEITAILDPVKRAGEFVPGLGSVFTLPVKATRPGLPTHDEGLKGMVALAGSAHAADRREAARRLGAIVATRDRSITAYPAASVMAAAGIDEALLRLTADPDWSVRAYAVDAVRWGRPNPRSTGARLAGALSDTAVPVRLMAVRLFATIQMDEFASALPRIAATDTALPVRLLAKSYTLPPPAPDPSGAPPSSQP